MRKKNLINLAAAVLLLLSACVIAVKHGPVGGDAPGPGTTIVVGRIVVDPPPEEGDKNGFNNGYDGQIRIFCDNVLRQEKAHDNSFWESWPVQITGNEAETFFYGLPNRRYYAVMSGYFMSRGGEYEMIHLPSAFTIDIAPGDRAVYIGTIKFTRDLYYHIKAVNVYDEYARVYPEFVKEFGAGIKLKKALARMINKNAGSDDGQ